MRKRTGPCYQDRRAGGRQRSFAGLGLELVAAHTSVYLVAIMDGFIRKVLAFGDIDHARGGLSRVEAPDEAR